MTSTIVASGAIDSITPFMQATNQSEQPKSVRSVIIGLFVAKLEFDFFMRLGASALEFFDDCCREQGQHDFVMPG